MFSFLRRSKKRQSDETTNITPRISAANSVDLARTAVEHNSSQNVIYEVLASIQTDVGCKRESNEDYGRCFRPSDPEILTRKGTLAIVADGMGGHSAGEVASKMAVEVIERVYYESPETTNNAALSKAFHEANNRIYQASLEDESLRGMGTTCTALVLQNGSAICGHVGDSRLYLLRGGDIYLMSEDHSEAGQLIRQGLLTIEEARSFADRNVILRALGSRAAVDVAMWEEPLKVKEGDSFVLCSDGLYDLVTDEEIKNTISSDDLHKACEELITLAKNRGGHDNITVAILRLRDPGSGETRPVSVTRDVTVPRELAETVI